MVVLRQFLVARFESWLMVVRFLYPTLEIIWMQDLRDTPKASKSTHTPCRQCCSSYEGCTSA